MIHKIVTLFFGLYKYLIEGHFGLPGQIDQIAACSLVLYALEVVVARRADDVQDVIELVEIVLAGKERLVVEHLGEYAADAPHVYGLVVALRVEHDLGRAIPARRHVLGEKTGVVVVRIGDARQAEVAYLQVAVGVEQQVARLEVAMQHICRVNELEAAKYLIEEVAHVLVAYRLGFKQLVQVGLHQTLHYVHVLHLIDGRRSNDVLYVDDL